MRNCLLTSFLILLVTYQTYAANEISGASGNWTSTSTWTSGHTPGSTGLAEPVFIRAGATVTVDSNVVPTAPGSVTNITIGEDSSTNVGTLVITTGGTVAATGSVAVMRSGNSLISGATGTLSITGGSLSVGTTFTVGAGTASQAGSGSGILNISGPAKLSITGAATFGSATAAQGSGVISIFGDEATISGSSLTVNPFTTINFALDATGISALNFSGVVSFATGTQNSVININGAGYTGGTQTFTVIDAGSFSGTSNVSINLSGFSGGYSASTQYIGSDLVLSVTVPEPSTVMLVGAGFALACYGFRRRSQSRPFSS